MNVNVNVENCCRVENCCDQIQIVPKKFNSMIMMMMMMVIIVITNQKQQKKLLPSTDSPIRSTAISHMVCVIQAPYV